MNPDLEVDTDELRRAAATLADTAARVTAGSEQAPAAEETPRWTTTDAAALASEAARQQLTHLAGDIAETARQITATAEAYELADTRAATRLRLTR